MVPTPTVADAAVAAHALVEAGAEEVLLFGSLARGEAGEHSDIDLVALFADIDYADRRDLKQRLEKAAEAAVDRWPVQVLVTDRPEWRARVERVSASFEHRISTETVRLAESTTSGPVTWEKEMVRPMTNADEALQYFGTHVVKRLKRLAASTTQWPSESDDSLPPELRETDRLDRMVVVCEDSAMIVELALKNLAVLHGVPVPSEKELRAAGHDIARCLALVPDPPRAAAEAAGRHLGVELATMSQWRVLATYPDEIDIERTDADRLAPDYVSTVLAVCELFLSEIEAAIGDTPAMHRAATESRFRTTYIANQDIRTGTRERD